jgi:hypothetical protein
MRRGHEVNWFMRKWSHVPSRRIGITVTTRTRDCCDFARLGWVIGYTTEPSFRFPAMGRSFQQPPSRSREPVAARWALALVSVIVLALASRAQAACGYYVVAAKPSTEMAGMRADMAHDIPGAPHVPCHGPNCQAGKQGAAPAAVIPGTPDTHTACCEAAAHFAGSRRSWILLNRDASVADVYLPTSAPPPRAA